MLIHHFFGVLKMQKPYRGDFKADYNLPTISEPDRTDFLKQYKKINKSNERGILYIIYNFFLFLCSGYSIIFFSKLFFNIQVSLYWCVVIAIFLHIVRWLIVKRLKDFYDEIMDSLLETDIENRFQDAMDRYNHWLQSQDEIYDVETRRKLRRAKAMREQSDEAALRLYRQIAEEQNIQNELIISLLVRGEQAEKIGDKSTLSSCLNDLDREFLL